MSFDPSLPTEQNPLSNQALTKKQRRDLKRQEKVATKESIEKSAARKRIALWAITGLVIIGIVFGMIKLAQMPNSTQTGTIPPVTEKDWKRGNPTAPAVLVDYSDFQCPVCATYHPILKQLQQDLGDKLLLVYRYLPLTLIHANAQLSAQAAEAAGRQNKFWEMHDKLFETQSEWEGLASDKAKAKFIAFAEELKLNKDQFTKDLTSSEVKDAVQTQLNGFIAGGFEQATPSFFLNGKFMPLPSNYEDLKSTVLQSISTSTSK
jgi:protein-disulfide isomerase